MITEFQTSIRKHALLLPGQRALAAVSGGADSVALLLALKESAALLRTKLIVAHLNHRIRGKAAAADAAFVRKLARGLEIQFAGGSADVPRLAAAGGLSMEMAARQARYAFLARAARKLNADVIVTAHTADDQAETVLLKLARGTSLHGLTGISRDTVINGVRVVRPMLDITRKDVVVFLKERKAAWREDATNRDASYLRNRVRHEILPFLESRLNPRISQALVRTADVLRDEDALLSQMAMEILEKASLTGEASAIDVAKMKRRPAALRRRVLLAWLVSAGVPAEAMDFDLLERVDSLLVGKKGAGRIEIGGGKTVERQYERLSVSARRRSFNCFRLQLKVPGVTSLKDLGISIAAFLKPGLTKQNGPKIGVFPAYASIRCPDVRERRIFARSWKAGDRMKPFGMIGSKKLQDIFVDEKVPVEERSKIPVFECDGEIIWIPGYRVARGWEVKNPRDVALQLDCKKVFVHGKRL